MMNVCIALLDPHKLETPASDDEITSLMDGLLNYKYEARRWLKVTIGNKESEQAQKDESWFIMNSEDVKRELRDFIQRYGAYGRKTILRETSFRQFRLDFEKGFAKEQGFKGYFMRRVILVDHCKTYPIFSKADQKYGEGETSHAC